MVFLDVGQGDGAFIRTYRGKTVLIDGGPENAGENSVVPFYWIMVRQKLTLWL
ncbi:late competence protein ComEC [Acetivibrio straminisolvens JCM 21531]|uniref:Late competence protein ComEC n=1 Tax=Acetivibrio straminisolvens JCM 21531 TaxID=1294263 RepID=W4V079_9FIRM|nr:late competence protein ComEC [Acetivibrio straminisolvens JCM 21531]